MIFLKDIFNQNRDYRIYLSKLYYEMSHDDFRNYCKENFQEIIDIGIDKLTKIPNNKWSEDKISKYINSLGELANILFELGYKELKEKINDTNIESVSKSISSDFEKALQLSGNEEIEKAIELLLTIEKYCTNLHGKSIRFFLPRVYGLLGLCYFKQNNIKHAKENTLIALELCKKYKDEEGVKIYLRNMEYFDDKNNKELRITTAST
jgi:tetratricopeptide (TPR) repeat protein